MANFWLTKKLIDNTKNQETFGRWTIIARDLRAYFRPKVPGEKCHLKVRRFVTANNLACKNPQIPALTLHKTKTNTRIKFPRCQ
jgi:hypothetical protein